ncbi:MAG: alanine--tRNA ligase, partial [Clostridiales Family XIII bacterium]|nr:alanine--tRNA ligase [Clostridiales Family XIII bacterium]
MRKIGLNELRELFKDFYVNKGHFPHASFSVVPENDKSLLLINSGMAPMKPYFSGAKKPPSKRMTTCQKCIRTGDLENVGHTDRHGTFFEMMGSFSFGDYFKRESLVWGWEFITQVLEMPEDRLWASIYEDDDEAYDIWKNDVGIDPSRILRMGKEDNFWEIGTGPCGPCSEVYYDRGEDYGCGRADCRPGCDCDRYVEFWNHVFTQFNKDEEGNYTPLEHPNIDTGMGLERIACIMQDTVSIFDVDTVRHILDGVSEASGVVYCDGKVETDISVRIVTDHIRSVAFMIADGVIPSNEGRGYVLRRLLRRAAVHGRKLGIEGPFLTDLTDRVLAVSGDAYPELREKREYLRKIVRLEEDRFAAAIDQGNALLNEYIDELKADGKTELSGDKVFRLYDTHGFNPELTREILAERGFGIDEEGYLEELRRRQEMSRTRRKTDAASGWDEDGPDVSDLPDTIFTGYDVLADTCKVLRIFRDGKAVEQVVCGDVASAVLDRTPFYAESGGQASDVGTMEGPNFSARVCDAQKTRGVFTHRIEVTRGALKTGDEVFCIVESARRNRTARNHTATHLLHRALKESLGDHVQQAGSFVDSEQLRFDFTHYKAIESEKMEEVEMIVNRVVDEFLPVNTEELSMDEARGRGATALFDEKYGDVVRVVSVGDFSMELCGGTHVRNSGEIGGFKILSESSVGSGTRRIEAVTGTNILQPFERAERVLTALGSMLKTGPDALVDKLEHVLSDMRDIRRELNAADKERMAESAE